MNCARRHFGLLVIPIFLMSTGRGAGPEGSLPVKESNDSLRAMLEKKGYAAIPLIEEEGSEGFAVRAKIGSESCFLLLDTGAESSSLDTNLVKKLGLKSHGEVRLVGIEGVRESVEVSCRGITIGDFDTRIAANSVSFAAYDFGVMNKAREKRKLHHIDGLLGQRALRLNAAVIDYSKQMLYLRSPLEGLWPVLAGRWVAIAGQEEGVARNIEPASRPVAEFKDRRFHLIDGKKQYTFGLHVMPGKGRYALVFFDPDQEFAKELNYKAGGLLKTDGDKLELCLCLDPSKAKGFPADFKAPAGSGHVLFEFRREK